MVRALLVALGVLAAFTAGCTTDRGQDVNGPFEGSGTDREVQEGEADADVDEETQTVQEDEEVMDVLLPGGPEDPSIAGPRGPVT